jgi:hypothetical protein
MVAKSRLWEHRLRGSAYQRLCGGDPSRHRGKWRGARPKRRSSPESWPRAGWCGPLADDLERWRSLNVMRIAFTLAECRLLARMRRVDANRGCQLSVRALCGQEWRLSTRLRADLPTQVEPQVRVSQIDFSLVLVPVDGRLSASFHRNIR